MKSDLYKSLCLEQAVRSPLHFRHGCVVVRGGKVIGRGFNDYRPGFSGIDPRPGLGLSSGLEGQSVGGLKRRRQTRKPDKNYACANAACVFGDTETIKSMHGLNGSRVPFSMHAEMMAIRNAIGLHGPILPDTKLHSQQPRFEASASQPDQQERERCQARVKAGPCSDTEEQRSGKSRT